MAIKYKKEIEKEKFSDFIKKINYDFRKRLNLG